jgi:predicted RNA-binding Zn ribbon-like protein
LKDTPSGVVVEERVEPGTSPLSLLGSVALEAAQLLTTVTPSRLRVCASPDCGTWFVDTSKGGRRRWCSMSGCGNRAKAAAHRAKQRDR